MNEMTNKLYAILLLYFECGIATLIPPLILPPLLQIYSLFLEALSVFIDDHREHLEDWLFLILLRLLHRHGSDLLGHMHFKLQLILELIRSAVW